MTGVNVFLKYTLHYVKCFFGFQAFIAVGAIIGSIIGGYSVDKFGRKTTIMCTSLLYTPGWCLISYADTVSMLYAGRILTGVAVGMSSLAVPVSVSVLLLLKTFEIL